MLIVHHHHHCKAKHSTTVKQECAQVIADRRYVIAKEIVDNWLRKAWISLLPSNLCQALESSLFSKQEQETRTRTGNKNKNKSNKNTKQEQEQDTATRTRNYQAITSLSICRWIKSILETRTRTRRGID
jgi:hypothetical protein